MPTCNKCGKSQWNMWKMKECNVQSCKVVSCDNCKDVLGLSIPTGQWYCLEHKDLGFKDDEESFVETNTSKSLKEEDVYYFFGENKEIIVFKNLHTTQTNSLITRFINDGYKVFDVRDDEIIIVQQVALL